MKDMKGMMEGMQDMQSGMQNMQQMMNFMQNPDMTKMAMMATMFSMMQQFSNGNMGGGKGSGMGCMSSGMGGGKGKGSGKTAVAGGSGEVRFNTPMGAQNALMHLNGSILNGAMVQIGLDERSQDGTKLCVNNLAAGTSWQDLKDHFLQAGQVAYAAVR